MPKGHRSITSSSTRLDAATCASARFRSVMSAAAPNHSTISPRSSSTGTARESAHPSVPSGRLTRYSARNGRGSAGSSAARAAASTPARSRGSMSSIVALTGRRSPVTPKIRAYRSSKVASVRSPSVRHHPWSAAARARRQASATRARSASAAPAASDARRRSASFLESPAAAAQRSARKTAVIATTRAAVPSAVSTRPEPWARTLAHPSASGTTVSTGTARRSNEPPAERSSRVRAGSASGTSGATPRPSPASPRAVWSAMPVSRGSAYMADAPKR